MNETIEGLEIKIATQRSEIINLKNQNDDLKCKGGELSPVKFDKLNSELSLAKEDINQKTVKIEQLQADLNRTVNALKDFHLRMVKLDQFAFQTTSTLQELVDTKIIEQTNKI